MEMLANTAIPPLKIRTTSARLLLKISIPQLDRLARKNYEREMNKRKKMTIEIE